MNANKKAKEGGGLAGFEPGAGSVAKKQEIVAALRHIPCFTAVNGRNEVYLRQDKGDIKHDRGGGVTQEGRGPQYVPWMLDGEFAIATLGLLPKSARLIVQVRRRSSNQAPVATPWVLLMLTRVPHPPAASLWAMFWR